MTKESKPFKTKSGRVLSEAELAALAAEAERGYNVDQLARRSGGNVSARDRLIDAGIVHIALYEKELGTDIPGWRTLARSTLDVFLAHPDDLLECLVEAGVLEWDGPRWLEVVARRTQEEGT